MAIGDDFSINSSGDIRHVSGTATYTVLELHRWLQDLADDASFSGNDEIDITLPNPSSRATDEVITLLSPYNIDDDAAEYFYGGSITQSDGDVVYSGLEVLGTVGSATTEIMVIQNNAVLTSFWGTGLNNSGSTLLRILVKTRNAGADIDGKRVVVQVREFTDSYDFFNITLGTGEGVVAINSADDSNNQNGYRDITVTGASGVFTVGETVTGGTTGAEAVVTSNTGSPTTSFQYYIVGDATTDFNSSETLTGSIVGANGSSSGASTSVNAATYTDVTVTFGLNETFDIDENTTNEDYSIVIDCNSRPLSEVYERLKYITRRGETATLNGIQGQQYIGILSRVDYNTLTGTINTGAALTQTITGGTMAAEVTAHDTTEDYLMLRDTRPPTSAFETGVGANNLEIDGSNFVTMTGATTVEDITPVKNTPFGSFVGGQFFGARGVVLDNVATADLENYQLIDNAGNTIIPPTKPTLSLTGIETDSEIRILNDDNVVDFNNELTGTESQLGSVQTASIVSGGTGYSVSDVLTVSGGTGTAATLTVDSVNSGVITGVSVTTGGSYSDNPTNPASVTGGGGSGATFNLNISGQFDYTYTYSTDINITVIVFHLSFKEIRLDLVLSNSSQSIPIQQNTDRVFSNP